MERTRRRSPPRKLRGNGLSASGRSIGGNGSFRRHRPHPNSEAVAGGAVAITEDGAPTGEEVLPVRGKGDREQRANVGRGSIAESCGAEVPDPEQSVESASRHRGSITRDRDRLEVPGRRRFPIAEIELSPTARIPHRNLNTAGKELLPGICEGEAPRTRTIQCFRQHLTRAGVPGSHPAVQPRRGDELSVW